MTHCESHNHDYGHSMHHHCGCESKGHMFKEEEHCHCGGAEKLLHIADEAWKEVLKDKIKAKIIEHKGSHMDRLAEAIAKANGERWKHKISAKTNYHEFKESLRELFSSCE